MERTIHFTLVDQVSTLNRITSAFVRLQCNIDELHVKHSDKEGICLLYTSDAADEQCMV